MVIKNNPEHIKIAAKQVLIESLGYDEGIAYHFLLLKKENDLAKEFSYSKRYRLLKSLFLKGALAKIKPNHKDFFSYVPLPPSFLHVFNIDSQIIGYLEDIYSVNFEKVILTNFSQMILKDERGLLIYLLKNHMKNSAQIVSSEIDLRNVDGIESSKIRIVKCRGYVEKRMGVFDGKIGFELTSIRGETTNEYIGFLAGKDHVNEIEESMKNVCY